MIRRIAPLLALLVCAAVSLGAGAADAKGRPTLVSGQYAVAELGATSCEPIDATRLRCRTSGLTSAYEGDLEGTSTADFDQVIDCAAGRTTGHGAETFTGSLGGGASGTLTWRLWLTAAFDCTTFFPSNLRIVAVVTRSTGAFAGSHGVLVFDDTSYRGVLG